MDNRGHFPSSGKLMDVKGVIVNEFGDDGPIVAERQYWNMVELLRRWACLRWCPKANGRRANHGALDESPRSRR